MARLYQWVVAVSLADAALVQQPIAYERTPMRPHFPHRHGTLTCSEDEIIVSLLETPDSDRHLQCYLAASTEFEGQLYAALEPSNAAIQLGTTLANGQLVPVEVTPALLARATAECSKVGIELLDTPVMLTAQGPGIDNVDAELANEDDEDDDYDDDYDDHDAGAIGSTDHEAGIISSEFDDDDDDGEGEAVMLVEFTHEGQDVFVVKPLSDNFIIGKQVERTTFILPSEAELEAAAVPVERMLAEYEAETMVGADEEDEGL